MAKTIDYHQHKYYENREISWLKFNERVLTEAEDSDNPLLERLKFLSIVSSNLDEFIMVRVASLRDMEHASYDGVDIAGMTVREQLNAVSKGVHDQVEHQYRVFNDKLHPMMIKEGINLILHHEDLSMAQSRFVDEYFDKEVYPVLTPMAVDSSRPFPLIRNKSLNIGALVKKKNGDGEKEFATVQVPQGLSRLVKIPDEAGGICFILLEEIIEKNIDKLFLNYDIVCAHPFRVMRNADLSIDEDEAEDLLKEIERQVRMRQWGEAIRLEVEKGMDKKLLSIIAEELLIPRTALFEIDGPLDMTFLMKFMSLEGYDNLKENSYISDKEVLALPSGCDVFERIRKDDIMMFHPYETFKPVVEFIRQAANAAYLFSNDAKKSEVEVITTAIAILLGYPDIQKPLTESILFAWVYAESVYDLRVLLAGGKVPIMKNDSTWHYSLGEMFFFAFDNTVSVNETSLGLSYIDYLRVLMSFEKEETKTMRFMDIIEMDIRKQPGNTNFRIDQCVDYLTADASITSSYGKSLSIKRTNFYY